MDNEVIYERDYKETKWDIFLYHKLPAIVAVVICGIALGTLLYMLTV